MWKLISSGVVGGLVGAGVVAAVLNSPPTAHREPLPTTSASLTKTAAPAEPERRFSVGADKAWVSEWDRIIESGPLPLDSGELRWTGLYASPSESLHALCAAIEERKIAASESGDVEAEERLFRMLGDADIARVITYRMIRAGDFPDETELLILVGPVFNPSADVD